MQIGNMFFHSLLFTVTSPLVSFTAAFCISPTGCFLCHSCCLFLYQSHRFFISPAPSFSVLYQSCCFLLYSVSVLLFLLCSVSVLLISSVFCISPDFFCILYQSYCFLPYSVSVLLRPLFCISPAVFFSVLYQFC
jgi:hypothetical protein